MKNRTHRKRPIRGKGKLGDILRKGKDFLKKTKVISKTLDNISSGPNSLMWVKPAAMLAKSYGYGSKRKTIRTKRRTLRGRGFMDWIKNKALPWLKKTKIISTVGNALAPIPGIGSVAGTVGKVAGAAGYGKRKRIRGRGINQQVGSGYGGSNSYSSGVVGMGRKSSARMPKRSMHGRGVGHLNTPFTKVGIPGAANYSSGRVQF